MDRILTLALAAVVVAGLAGGARGETGYGDSAPFELNTAARAGSADDGIPRISRLGGCRPNPFNPGTFIAFELAEPAAVHLAVYDLRGRLVRALVVREVLPAGRHEVRWDGRDTHGSPAAGGVYLYRIKAGGLVDARSMTLVK